MQRRLTTPANFTIANIASLASLDGPPPYSSFSSYYHPHIPVYTPSFTIANPHNKSEGTTTSEFYTNLRQNGRNAVVFQEFDMDSDIESVPDSPKLVRQNAFYWHSEETELNDQHAITFPDVEPKSPAMTFWDVKMEPTSPATIPTKIHQNVSALHEEPVHAESQVFAMPSFESDSDLDSFEMVRQNASFDNDFATHQHTIDMFEPFNRIVFTENVPGFHGETITVELSYCIVTSDNNRALLSRFGKYFPIGTRIVIEHTLPSSVFVGHATEDVFEEKNYRRVLKHLW